MMKSLLAATAFVLGFAQAAFGAEKGFVCIGTEPFFAVVISLENGEMYVDAPEYTQTQTYRVEGPHEAQGLSDGVVTVFKGVDATATLVSEVLAGKCNDGMSDNEHPYHLILLEGNTVKYGCCR
mgnify:CR=1 FL=1